MHNGAMSAGERSAEYENPHELELAGAEIQDSIANTQNRMQDLLPNLLHDWAYVTTQKWGSLSACRKGSDRRETPFVD